MSDQNTRDGEVIFWGDVETNGFLPFLMPSGAVPGGDHPRVLLEIAGFVSDTRCEVISEDFERVVLMTRAERDRAYQEAGEFVRQMHEHTGLWDRVLEGTPLEQIDRDLLALLSRFAPEPRGVKMAGNSLRLDLNFIEAYLPLTYAHLHYQSLDVSAVAYMAHSQGYLPHYFTKAKGHSALADAKECFAEYLDVLAHLPAPPVS